MVKNERGLSLIIFVFMIMVTTTVIVAAYGFLIVYEQRSSGIELSEQKALYIAETGIERAMEYLEDDTDWSDDNGTAVISENFGAGSYSVDLSNGTKTTIVVSSTGTVDSGPRQVKRKIRQKIRRLPEAFNYAVFSDSTNVLRVSGTVRVRGGDFYSRGNIAGGGTLNVPDGGTISALRGGFVYSEGSVTTSGTYTVGTTPVHTPPMPVLDTTYYDNLMAGFDFDISIYNTDSAYLGWTGTWESNPNGVVNIVLSGNRYFTNFKVTGSSSITGSGAIISDTNIRMENITTVTPDPGGAILLIARDNIRLLNRISIGTNTTLYSKDGLLRVINRASVQSSTLLSGAGIRVLNRADIDGAIFYNPSSTDTIVFNGINVSVTDSTVLSRGGIRIIGGSSVGSDSVVYAAQTADRILVAGSSTVVDGAVLSNSQFRLNNNATVTGIVYASEADPNNGTINGSLIADSFAGDRIGSSGNTVTINYDHIDYSYFPETPAGLGLDIDGDANEEGIIVKVPGTWEQL